MERAAHVELIQQLNPLSSKSSSRLRLSDDRSRVTLAGADSPALPSRVAERKESSQIDVSEQVSDKPTSQRSRPPNGALPIALVKPEMQPSPPVHDTMTSSAKPRPNRAITHGQRSPFLAILPHDIHYVLAVDYLDFDAILALRQTCRIMLDLLNNKVIRRIRSEIVLKSLDDEHRRFRDYRQLYPRQRLGALWDLLYAAFDFRLIERPAKELRCYGCLEVKPLWCFVERMSNKGTGLGAKSARDRMCKDCMRRFRNIEGQWWKENWVKKSDTVRKASRSKRVKRWALEGQSLVNPDEEVGVCSCCGSGTFELWWGCVTCFELEEKCRREEDLIEYAGLERKIIDMVELWRVRKESKRRTRQATRERRSRSRWWMPAMNLNLHWEGGFAERKAALLEWKDHRNPGAAVRAKRTIDGINPGDREPSGWRAINQIPLPKNRREARCSSCWVPNCPRRTYILGLAYERPLPRDRWCDLCQDDYESRRAKKRGLNHPSNQLGRDAYGIFSDDWHGGLGSLFDET